MSYQNRFSDRLIAAEQVDSKRKERYEMEMQRLLNPRLPTARRVICAVVGLVGLLAGLDFGVMTASTRMSGDYDWFGRVVFGVMAALLLAFGFLTSRMAVRGKANIRRDVSTVAMLRWGMGLVVAAAAMVLAWFEVKYNAGRGSAFYAGVAVVFTVFGAVHIITDQIRRSGLCTQEKLLEMELKLADLADKTDSRR